MKGSQVPASAYLVAWWCEPWLRVVRCVRVWCVCGGFGAAVVEMPKGATSDRWVYIHMHAAGSVASWQFQPSPPALLFMCMPRSAQPPAPPPVLIPSAAAAASAATTKAASAAAATAIPHRLRHDRHLLIAAAIHAPAR